MIYFFKGQFCVIANEILYSPSCKLLLLDVKSGVKKNISGLAPRKLITDCIFHCCIANVIRICITKNRLSMYASSFLTFHGFPKYNRKIVTLLELISSNNDNVKIKVVTSYYNSTHLLA